MSIYLLIFVLANNNIAIQLDGVIPSIKGGMCGLRIKLVYMLYRLCL